MVGYAPSIVYCPYIPVMVSKQSGDSLVREYRYFKKEVKQNRKTIKDTRTQDEIDICNELLG